jgi:hypothetical protein
VKRSHAKIREEARRMFLAGEVETNAELAARLHVKPHTIGHWRRAEEWDSLRRKIDVRAAEMFVEKIASERTALNMKHYRIWEHVLARMTALIREKPNFDVRDLERMATVLDRAQKGQRLAKGLADPETEEAIRAQGEAETRRLVDLFIESVKENVNDESTRNRIRKAILDALPDATGERAGKPGDTSVQ